MILIVVLGTNDNRFFFHSTHRAPATGRRSDRAWTGGRGSPGAGARCGVGAEENRTPAAAVAENGPGAGL
jgi:hypothetical protein